MLTIFNRAELLITYDLTRFNQVRYALEGGGSTTPTAPRIWPATTWDATATLL